MATSRAPRVKSPMSQKKPRASAKKKAEKPLTAEEPVIWGGMICEPIDPNYAYKKALLEVMKERDPITYWKIVRGE